MSRQRITQKFPWLLPIRKKQRLFCFYTGMRFDGNRYAVKKGGTKMPYQVFRTELPLYNRETGFDMKYQENKVFNLKLAAETIDHLLLGPQETFSFWKLVRYADREIPYKDGLIVVDGMLKTAYGGGLCQMSNLLFWLFLHSPLTIVERHGHSVRDFPEGSGEMPAGIDSTVSEGWLDLKVRNDTDVTFQISLSFTKETVIGELLAERDMGMMYQITNENLSYERQGQKVFEEVDVVRKKISFVDGRCVDAGVLYRNRCEIGYPVPEKRRNKIIAVIFGGCSPEYSVSLASAHAVISQIRESGKYDLVLLGISREGDWFCFDGDIEKIVNDTWCNAGDCTPAAISPSRSRHEILLLKKGETQSVPIDAAFPVLHGKNGEDGTVQGLFELAGIPVVGCGVLSSALCMDKYRAHELVRAAGITVPKAFIIQKRWHEKPEEDAPGNAGLEAAWMQEIEIQAEQLGLPLFVKPVRAGSSFGVTKVKGMEELPAAIAEAFLYDDSVILEECIPGFEAGCAVLGNEEVMIGEVDEIELADGFFDFTEKYTLKTSAIHVPARVDVAAALRIKQTAETIYRILGCKGLARVDLFVTPSGEIVFNEVNTIPGFTTHSRFPNMMRAAGYSFAEILERLLKGAGL